VVTVVAFCAAVWTCGTLGCVIVIVMVVLVEVVEVVGVEFEYVPFGNHFKPRIVCIRK